MINIQPNSVNNKFRRSRLIRLVALAKKYTSLKNHCRILDVGGTYNFWYVWRDYIDWETIEITCINRDPTHFDTGHGETRVRMLTGDATDMTAFSDREYDIAFSNSVIEHVGRWRDMVAMADEVKRVAESYVVQTPNFWFPIEPHARTPFLHWLPEPWAYRVVMMRKCGYWKKQDTVAGAVQTIQSAKLLDMRQMQTLFPDANVIRERFLGMTKALIAIKDGTART